MGLGGKFGGSFWIRIVAKASNSVAQFGNQRWHLSGYRQGAQVVGLFTAKFARDG